MQTLVGLDQCYGEYVTVCMLHSCAGQAPAAACKLPGQAAGRCMQTASRMTNCSAQALPSAAAYHIQVHIPADIHGIQTDPCAGHAWEIHIELQDIQKVHGRQERSAQSMVHVPW